MYWRLLPTLNACIASDRLILLDIEGDRYSAVPSEIAAPTIDWLRADDDAAAPAAFAARLGQQVLGKTAVDVALSEILPPDVTPLQTLRSTVSAAAAVGTSWLALRTRRLKVILDRRARLRGRGTRADTAILRSRAQAFITARRWCPINPNCPLDSLALDRWLGAPANVQLVFGVVGQPFEAHCWVQSGGEVLNDSYDRVSRFEPILTV
jgi:hypothetical protein